MRKLLLGGLGALAVAIPVGTASAAGPRTLPKQPVAYGTGGGAATMSPYATDAAIRVLKQGGNAVDGAVAAAAALGVSEPFVAGPGGGGFFVYYRARDHKVFTIDGREKAPAGATPDMFLENGQPENFEKAVESGKSVGVPGNVATWGVALRRFGTRRLARVLRPAERVASKGFPLDAALAKAIKDQRAKLYRFPASAQLFMHGAEVPERGDVLRNPDLARTYRQIGRHGWRWFYTGPIARELANTVQHPPTRPGTPPVAAGTMTAGDMRNYTAPFRPPLSWTYRGYKLHGMAPPSSGGTTIGETMNILENFDQRGDDRDAALYRYLEACKLAYADRGKYVGDTDFVGVPLTGLLSKDFARERAGLIGPKAASTPVAPGNPWAYNGSGASASYAGGGTSADQHTNHLVVADREGNVVSYTNTIEQIAGSGITVPGRGFLLNNELTDFNFATGTANSVQGNKRPRSSMSPTLVTRGGKVVEAIGSPGGSTIITTVLQTLLNQIDFGMSLPAAIEAPRASQTAGSPTSAEPAFTGEYGKALTRRGEEFEAPDDGYIGIVAGLAFLPGGRLQTATEAWRGGGGSAMVVRPENPVPKGAAKARALAAAR
jgi:gamma-glutamyltranspeptidase / glutathione hydrolase